MEIQSGNRLEDTLHNLKEFASAGSLDRVISTAKELVDLFNDAELGFEPLTARHYQLFLITHLIVLDTTNAQFLWKRVPATFKAEPKEGSAPQPKDQVLKELWQIARALINKQYPEAFKHISVSLRTLIVDTEKNQFGDTVDLLQILHKVLREHHVVEVIRRSYQTIEISQARALLGLDESDSNEILTRLGFTLDGTFMQVPHNMRREAAAQFQLSQEKISDLVAVVQYLEQQKVAVD